jgi:hypothetical protein
VQKSAAKQRSAELLAEFDNQLAAEYAFDDDAVWQQAAKAADAEVTRANAQIARRCQQLGIPPRFAPKLSLVWRHQGYDNSVKQRREELRRAAQSRIEAIEREVVVKIEMASVEAQTELATAGLTSAAARDFVASLPSVESLMPALSYAELAGEAEPPIPEQLVSPSALRQRRHRERQKALRNGGVTSPALPPS